MSSKTRKAIAKRFKLTGNKKLVHRKPGQNHFRARKKGKLIRKTHRPKSVENKSLKKRIFEGMSFL